MKQTTVIHLLLGMVLLPAIILLYLLLAPHGQQGLSPSGWMWFGSAALILILAVFAPILVRRARGLPEPPPLSPSDIRFVIALIVIVGILTFCVGGAFGSLAIMLVPIAFYIRFRRGVSPVSSDRNA